MKHAARLALCAFAFALTSHAFAQSGQYYWLPFVGNGTATGVDGTGTAATFTKPIGLTLDGSGNLYVASNCGTIRKVTPGAVTTTLAGQNTWGFANGTGSAALFNQPWGIALDGSNNAYIVDSGNCMVRKMTPANVVTTLAGAPGLGGSTDGVGAAARFYLPNPCCTDSNGNLYLADSSNSTIRMVTSTGSVTTIAGIAMSTGTADGTGTAARFHFPLGITIDGSSNLYVADTANNTIRKVTPAGVVTTFAGTPGVSGTTDGPIATALFNNPVGIAIDGSNNFYITDTQSNTIREITAAGMVVTIGGTPHVSGMHTGLGPQAQFNDAEDLVVAPNGIIYVADSFNNRILEGVPAASVAFGSLSVTIDPAGAVSAGAEWQVDGGAFQASGATVTGLLAGSHVVTFGAASGWLAPASVNVTVSASATATLVGTYTSTAPPPASPGQYTWTNLAGRPGVSGVSDGPEAMATFSNVMGIAVDGNGDIFVADSDNSTIREISGGIVSTVAGTPGVTGSANGIGSAARFYDPFGLAFGLGGNLDIVDSANGTIRVMNPEDDLVTTIAGTPWFWGYADGTGPAAEFHFPSQIATDAVGNMYVADSYNDTIRKVTPAGVVTTIAGSPLQSGTVDGTGTNARFWHPYGIAVDSSTNIYVDDDANSTIRKITPAGVVTTIAGTPGVTGTTDGYGSSALFNSPFGLAIDGSNNLYVADSGNNTIRMITPGGYVRTIGGTPGVSGTAVGVGAAVQFSNPWDITITPGGVIYVADTGNDRIVMGVLASGTGSGTGTFTTQDAIAFTPGNGAVTIAVLENDTAPAGGTLSVIGVTQGTNGKVTINPNGTITYTPGSGFNGVDSFSVTVSDGLGATATNTVLIGNGFITGAGSYAGLVSNPVVTNTTSGAIELTMTRVGQYSGQLSMAGLAYRVTGSFNHDWSSEVEIPRKGQSSLTLDLQFNPDTKQITGTAGDGAFTSSVNADIATYSAKSNPAPADLAGGYTLLLPSDLATSGSADYPQGCGYATVNIDAGGNVALTGELGDGTPLSASGLVVSGTTFPLYAGLYGKTYPEAGSIFGSIDFDTAAATCSGTLCWFKPAQSAGHFYKSGFSTETAAIGSRYEAPKKGTDELTLPVGGGSLAITGGDLVVPFDETFTQTPNTFTSYFTANHKSKLVLNINPGNGTFTGAFNGAVNSPNGQKIIQLNVSGAILQNQNLAGGLFRGVDQSGEVDLVP